MPCPGRPSSQRRRSIGSSPGTCRQRIGPDDDNDTPARQASPRSLPCPGMCCQGKSKIALRVVPTDVRRRVALAARCGHRPRRQVHGRSNRCRPPRGSPRQPAVAHPDDTGVFGAARHHPRRAGGRGSGAPSGALRSKRGGGRASDALVEDRRPPVPGPPDLHPPGRRRRDAAPERRQGHGDHRGRGGDQRDPRLRPGAPGATGDARAGGDERPPGRGAQGRDRAAGLQP